MSGFPSVVVGDDIVKVRFSGSEATAIVTVESVLDMTDFGDVVGVEILDLRRQLGGGLEPRGSRLPGEPKGAGPIRWSYDNEIDAFYMHLREGRVDRQPKAIIKALLDSSQRMVGLDIPVTT